MQNSFPIWKNILVIAIFVLGTLYSLPILYGDDPSVQISTQNGSKIEPGKASQIESEIKAVGINAKAFEFNDGRVLARFKNTDDQLKITDLLKDKLGDDLTVAMNLAPATPSWLSAIGADPMYLGLDLRGGVHFLLEVDMDAALKQAEERYTEDLRIALREAKIRYQSVSKDGGFIKLTLKSAEDKAAVFDQLSRNFKGLKVTEPSEQDQLWVKMSEADEREIKKNAVAQNMTTLRNRVNELGVAEPVIQQQGENRIVVQLPGVQDTTRAKEILGTTATLEYRLVDEEHDVQQAVQGHVPVNSKLYYDKNKVPVLLEKRVIVTGNQIVDASSGMDQDGRPAVFITLNGAGAGKMGKLTQVSVGKRMAVVFIENKAETKMVDGQKVRTKATSEKVISVATIQGVFSKRFQTTGLDSPQEARNLALLLRAGALAAPVDIVEERTVGPSLGQDNINKGMLSFVVGFGLVVVFMMVYYKQFGIIANIALVFNVVIILAILSLLQATLTLPGIAGIVLTVGMSVDANVLIFERIREEIRNGTSPQAAIYLGYEKAFATIFDSNITTLLIAVILFAFGTGPVKGFAVTLSIGILSSMFTAITGTRMIVNWLYGNKRLDKISI
jgi:preprotein translocase subunit SecD